MEDYKKKYEQALEYMRTVYPILNGVAKKDVEHYFPELKESEDERVGKAIIKLVKGTSKSYTINALGVDQKDMINYLEKQGEMKFAWSEEDERIKYNLIKYCVLCRSMSCCSRDRVDEAIAWLKSLKERLKGE